MDRHVRRLNRVHFPCAALRRPDGQDTASGPHVQYHFIFELLRVQSDRVVVGRHSFLVLEHVFLVVEVSVCAKVVCEVGVSDLVGFEHDHVAVLWGGGWS